MSFGFTWKMTVHGWAVGRAYLLSKLMWALHLETPPSPPPCLLPPTHPGKLARCSTRPGSTIREPCCFYNRLPRLGRGLRSPIYAGVNDSQDSFSLHHTPSRFRDTSRTSKTHTCFNSPSERSRDLASTPPVHPRSLHGQTFIPPAPLPCSIKEIRRRDAALTRTPTNKPFTTTSLTAARILSSYLCEE